MVMTRLSSSRLGPSRLVAGVGAIVLVAGLALAGCGKSDEELGIGVTTPVPTGSDTSDGSGGSSDGSGGGPDASDGSTPVASPPARTATRPNVDDYPNMHEDTLQGAEQAFQYYMASYVYGTGSGETTVLEQMSDPDCETCTSFIEAVGSLHAQGKYSIGKSVAFTDIQSFEGDDNTVFASLIAHVTEADLYDPSRGVVTSEAREDIDLSASMRYAEGAWTIESAGPTPDGIRSE